MIEAALQIDAISPACAQACIANRLAASFGTELTGLAAIATATAMKRIGARVRARKPALLLVRRTATMTFDTDRPGTTAHLAETAIGGCIVEVDAAIARLPGRGETTVAIAGERLRWIAFAAAFFAIAAVNAAHATTTAVEIVALQIDAGPLAERRCRGTGLALALVTTRPRAALRTAGAAILRIAHEIDTTIAALGCAGRALGRTATLDTKAAARIPTVHRRAIIGTRPTILDITVQIGADGVAVEIKALALAGAAAVAGAAVGATSRATHAVGAARASLSTGPAIAVVLLNANPATE